jgi:hypothetical protein
MYEALLKFAREGFAQRWMGKTDESANEWMRAMLREHRAAYEELCAGEL